MGEDAQHWSDIHALRLMGPSICYLRPKHRQGYFMDVVYFPQMLRHSCLGDIGYGLHKLCERCVGHTIKLCYTINLPRPIGERFKTPMKSVLGTGVFNSDGLYRSPSSYSYVIDL